MLYPDTGIINNLILQQNGKTREEGTKCSKITLINHINSD